MDINKNQRLAALIDQMAYALLYDAPREATRMANRVADLVKMESPL